MRIGKLGILVLFCISVFAFSAVADSTISVNAQNNQVSAQEQAEYTLKITNHLNEKQRYSIFSFVQGWNVYPNPLKDKIIDLGPGKTYTTTILAQPIDDFPPGIYYVSVNVESDHGEKYSQSLKIYLSPEKPVDYLPSIAVDIDMDEKVDPTKPVPITLFLENKNPLDLSGLVVKLQSDVPEFVQESTVDLEPLGKKTVDFTLVPNKYQQPKEYTLFFVFEREGQTVKVIEKNMEVISLQPSFTTSIEETSSFFKSLYTVSVTNPGNVKNSQEVLIPVSFLESLVATGSEKQVADESGQKYLVWERTLSPSESTTVQYITNYRMLIYALILLAAIALFYWVVRSPIVVTKTAVTTKADEEGALSQIKITLEVRNKSTRSFKDVEILDWVPVIANVEKSLELGTLRPKAVRHTKHGAKVIWSLAELDAHEHRLITYNVRAKLNILGTFSLPRATVEFRKKQHGKKLKSYSNITRLRS